jgi:mRNA interferase MazF
LVLSHRRFHELSNRAIVCPITRNIAPWPTKVLLPDGLAANGAVLVDQVRSVDRAYRGFRRIGFVPREILALVREVLAALLGIDGIAFFGGTEGR